MFIIGFFIERRSIVRGICRSHFGERVQGERERERSIPSITARSLVPLVSDLLKRNACARGGIAIANSYESVPTYVPVGIRQWA